MATSTPLKATQNKDTTPGSTNLIPAIPKHVSLYDWWLIKADTPCNGRVLGVGGLSSKEQLGVRILHSAAIVKRHNTNIVETADGLIITLSGSINKPRTVLNGFPSEVCNQFSFGFPYCWEELFMESFAKEATKSKVNNSADAANNFLSKSFDNLPGALMRDFFLSEIESSESRKLRSIFGDMLHGYGVDSLNQRSEFIPPSEKNNQVTVDSEEVETDSGHKKIKVKQKQNDEDDTGGAKSRKRSQKVRGEDHCLSSSKKGRFIKVLSEAPIERHGGSVTKGNVSSTNSTTRTLSLRNRSIEFIQTIEK